MQTEINPMRKNRDFRMGLLMNVLEGILSGSNFMLLYAVMQALEAGTLDMNRIGLLTGVLTAIFLLRMIIYSTGYVWAQTGGASVSRQVRLFLGDKLRRIPLARFSQGQMGEYINTLTANVNNYEKILTHKTGDLAKNISLSIMLIAFVGSIWLPAGGILLLGGLLLIPALQLSFRAVKKYGNQKNEICAEAVSSIVEYISGIQTLRAYGVGGARNKTTVAAMRAYRDICYHYEAKVIPIGFAYSILLWMTLPFTMWIVFGPWTRGTLDTVSYLLLCMFPIFFAKLCGTIFIDLTSYKNLMISKKQITDMMREPEESGSDIKFSPDSYDIVMENVGFSYHKGEPVLKDISFTAGNGKLTAVVGDSGSGKSTILNLIAKYYEPQNGSISIGGQPVKDLQAAQVLSLVSMVDQDVFLFEDTVRNNIRHARPSATDAEVEAACQDANCDEFILKLPKGYDTSIGENGNFLSGGECQRLSIARAILKNSPILLLDEATANLDVENELVVKQAISRLLSARKTVVMIAHTLSVIRGADQILVIGEGKILESGTHEELLRKNGKYVKMWNAENT